MLIFICFLLLLICYLIDSIFRNKYPKQYKKNIYNGAPTYNRVAIDRDRYSKKKIPKNIDAIVIGSGIGGLSTAAILAKVGKKVLVLEQHYIAGGCTHSFEEKGVEHETGIHYIGNIEKRKKIFDLISDSEIEWCKMGKENNGVYDEIYIKDKKYLFRAGKENFIQDLVKVFPEEEKNIRDYIDLIIKVAQKDLYFNLKIIQSEWLYYFLSFFISKDYYKYVNAIAYDVIKQFTQNEDLIAVLCGQFGDYGAPPTKASFFVHASIVNHYLEGGYFPKYGTSNIPKKIIPTIEKSGGRVLVGKTVKKILIKNNQAYGIEMCNGDKIYADNIISGIGIRNTYQKLIHVNNDIVDKNIAIPYNTLIEKIPPSVSFMYLFVNLSGTPEELNLRSSNLWVWPDKNYEKVLDDFENNPLENPMPFFIGCSCAKDSSWNDRFPGKSNAIILTTAKKEWFDIWEDEKCMHRGQEYNDFKDKFAQRMLNEGLFKFYPQLKGKVEHYDVGTPLTNQFYLGAYEGEAYGLDSTPTRYSESSLLRPKTNIKNFYLTGQDICTLGFTGALMAGVLTAHSVLGYGTMLDLISNRNLISDVINLDKKIKSDTNIKIMPITKKIA